MAGVGGVRWTPEEVRTTRPDVLDAARWLVFAERIWPGADAEAQLFAPENPSDAWIRAEKLKGRSAIGRLRKLLLPEDE